MLGQQETKMMCKIDHTLEGAIPVILCRACNPGKFTKAKTVPTQAQAAEVASTLADHAERMERRQRRKLRAESKRLQDEIDKIAGHNPPATAKIQAVLDGVNRELYLVS
jgi:hypothetical protein